MLTSEIKMYSCRQSKFHREYGVIIQYFGDVQHALPAIGLLGVFLKQYLIVRQINVGDVAETSVTFVRHAR